MKSRLGWFMAGALTMAAMAAAWAANKEVVLSDNVTDAILDFAMSMKVDLVAIATRGTGGMRRFVFGTVADELTRRSPISLLVFHPRTATIAGEINASEFQALAVPR